MLTRMPVILLIGAVALATSADAQSTPPPAAITRTVIATTKLPSVTEVPLYFRAVSVTLSAGREEQRLCGQWHPLSDVGIDRGCGR